MLRLIQLTLTCLLLIAGTVTAQDALTIQPVKDGLYAIFGSGGNVGVRVTPAGVILIDDKFPQNFDEIQRLVGTVSRLPVKYVINSHHHGDHSGSNPSFIDSAEIIAHRNARANMIRGNQEGAPEIVYSDETAVYLGGVEVQVHYYGTGHTNGDSIIYFPDLKTVHGGDILHGIAPFIDYANGGSSRGWVGTVNGILSLDFDTAIPGHGEIMTRGDVVNFRNQMEAVRERMKMLVRSGASQSEAVVRIKDASLPWTMVENGLFMQRSVSGFYDEISAELQQ